MACRSIAITAIFLLIHYSFTNNAIANDDSVKWDDARIEESMGIFKSRFTSVAKRVRVIDQLEQDCENIDEKYLWEIFDTAISVSKRNFDNSDVNSSALWMAYNFGKEYVRRGKLTQENLSEKLAYMHDIALDKHKNDKRRCAAFRIVAELGDKDLAAITLNILSEKPGKNNMTVFKRALLAISSLQHKDAEDVINGIIAEAKDPSVYHVAIYSLGRVNSKSALRIMMQNKDRYRDTHSFNVAIPEMEDIILSQLEDGYSEETIFAIQATKYLWKEGQREKYIPKLRELLSDSSPEIQVAAAERLFDAMMTMHYDEGKEEMRRTLPYLSSNPNLREYERRIRGRLNAVPVTPVRAVNPPPDDGWGTGNTAR